MLRLIRNLVVFILFMIFTAIGLGECHPTTVHPSHNASYVHKDMCFIDATVSPEHFRELADWCVDLRSKE